MICKEGKRLKNVAGKISFGISIVYKERKRLQHWSSTPDWSVKYLLTGKVWLDMVDTVIATKRSSSHKKNVAKTAALPARKFKVRVLS